jgi:hypothetical protein
MIVPPDENHLNQKLRPLFLTFIDDKAPIREVLGSSSLFFQSALHQKHSLWSRLHRMNLVFMTGFSDKGVHSVGHSGWLQLAPVQSATGD